MNGTAGARRVELPDSVVWALLALPVALIAWAWLAAQAAALVTSGQPAQTGISDAITALPRLATAPGDPDAAYATTNLPGPLAFWSIATFVAAAFMAGALAVLVTASRRQGRPGMAHRDQLRHLSSRAVARRARVLRPDLPEHADRNASVTAAGVALGRHHPSRMPIYGTVEDSYLVIAPPRTGKTVRVVVPTVLDYPGPAVVTSTRWEAVDITAATRAAQGPVWVFDTDTDPTATDRLPAHVQPATWSPVAGCDDPQTAMIRAHSLARAAGAGTGIENGEFWATHAETVLSGYLHAAALGGRSIADVRRWALDPTSREPATLLRDSPTAAAWGGDLLAESKVSDRQRDGIWGVVQQSLAALRAPGLLARCVPTDGTGFDPAELLNRNGTLYIVGRAETQHNIAPLVAALVEAVVGAARTVAAHQPGGRLSPPLLVALDEAANIAPLPTLPTLVADGGGSGITTMVVLQSRARARERWGEDAAEAIVAACTHRLILGGGGELRELDDLARLVGERDDEVRSHSWQPWGQTHTGTSTSTSLRRVPIITPADLQALPKGRGVLCCPNTPPAEIVLPAWWERPDAALLQGQAA